MSHGKFPFTLSDYLRLKASAVVVNGGAFFISGRRSYPVDTRIRQGTAPLFDRIIRGFS